MCVEWKLKLVLNQLKSASYIYNSRNTFCTVLFDNIAFYFTVKRSHHWRRWRRSPACTAFQAYLWRSSYHITHSGHRRWGYDWYNATIESWRTYRRRWQLSSWNCYRIGHGTRLRAKPANNAPSSSATASTCAKSQRLWWPHGWWVSEQSFCFDLLDLITHDLVVSDVTSIVTAWRKLYLLLLSLSYVYTGGNSSVRRCTRFHLIYVHIIVIQTHISTYSPVLQFIYIVEYK